MKKKKKNRVRVMGILIPREPKIRPLFVLNILDIFEMKGS